MKYIYEGDFFKGIFINRPNRFIAEVDLAGRLVRAHVANTGRMAEILTPGKTCYLRLATNPNRKTKYDLISIDHGGIVVNLDSQIPNKIVEMAFGQGLISGYEDPVGIKREVQVGDSRLDILVQTRTGQVYVEVKGVDLVYGTKASFPDAPTTRGVKHLRTLMDLVKEGHQAMNIYLLARDDAEDFRPNMVRDPAYAQAFYEAMEAGVQMRAYLTHNSYRSISFGKQVPIVSKDQMVKDFEIDQIHIEV